MSNFNITPMQRDKILREGLYGIFPHFESSVPREGSRYRWQEACGEWPCVQARYACSHYRSKFEIMKHFERTQNISIHSPLKILVSVLDEGKNTCITGFEMVYSNEPNKVLAIVYQESRLRLIFDGSGYEQLMYVLAKGVSRPYVLAFRLRRIRISIGSVYPMELGVRKRGLS
jgi:hypothetical protein